MDTWLSRAIEQEAPTSKSMIKWWEHVTCKEFTLENTGPIEGEKMMLKDFAEQFANMTYEIVDETFGYHTTKFEGYLYLEEGTVECNISIYHMGDMSYLTDK